MRRSARVMLAAAIGVLAAASASWAQGPQAGRIEISGGVRWIGPIDYVAVPANETTLGGGTRALFNSDTQLDGSLGATAAVGVRLARRLTAEFSMAYNPASLTTRISNDTEGVAALTVDAPVSQFLFEGGLVAELRRGRRVSPFLTGGAGYLRQLNDGRTLVQTGRSFYVGAGLYYVRASARPRRLKATGLRLDGRALFMRDGVAPDSATRGAPALTASVFARF